LRDALMVIFPRGSYRPTFQRREISAEIMTDLQFPIENWNGPRVRNEVIRPLEQKAKRCPLSAFELSLLAAAYCQAAYWGDQSASEIRSRAIAAARRSVETWTDSSEFLSNAVFGRACVEASFERKFAVADKGFSEALKICPTNAFAHSAYAVNVLAPSRRLPEALTHATLAVSLMPRSLYTHSTVAWVHFYSRHYDVAIEGWQKVLENFSQGFSPRYGLACAFAEQGNWNRCFAAFEDILRDWPEQPYITALVGHYKARQKDKDAAAQILTTIQQDSYVSPYGLALIHAGLGDLDETFQFLDKADQEGDVRLAYLDIVPFWQILRRDVRYRQLGQRLQLPQFQPLKKS
jgi:tetratricopeptide (TPR) repeat protein